jgi:hypothetical protein
MPRVTLDIALKLVMAAIAVGSTACNVYLFLKSRSDERFEKVNGRLDGHDEQLTLQAAASTSALSGLNTRMTVIESEIENLPTHRDLDGIRADLALIKASSAATEERSRGLVASVNRIEDHLLNR